MKISLMQFNLSKLSKILCLIFNLLLDRHINKHIFFKDMNGFGHFILEY